MNRANTMFFFELVHQLFSHHFLIVDFDPELVTLKLLETTKKETVLQRAAKPSEAQVWRIDGMLAL